MLRSDVDPIKPGMAPDSTPPQKLSCPSASAVAAFKEGIAKGDIVWHAMPFNAEPELVDSSLFDALLRIAQNLVILC